jgi:hypothetical protein
MQLVRRCLECDAVYALQRALRQLHEGVVLLANSATIFGDKQERFCIVNGGGDGDQQQSTTTTDNCNEQFVNNVDNDNSRKTISISTMHQIRHNNQILHRHIEAADWDSTSMSELQEHVINEVALVRTSSSSVRTKAISVRSMSKALSGARLAGGAQGAAHRGRFGSLQAVRFCMRIRASYCCNYFASAADVRTHILADHIRRSFTITIKKESDG